MKKTRDLLVIATIYVLAYGLGYAASIFIDGLLLQMAVFDVVATVVVFVFSVIFHNSSVYDAYWSLTPMVMSIWMFVVQQAFDVWQVLFLLVFNVWAFRLTFNWCVVFTDFSYEDWRYKKFREENTPFFWFMANFWGIHMVPTIVVFAGMLPLFEIVKLDMNAMCIPGLVIILYGVALEFFADRQMHWFLDNVKEKITCRIGLWGLSRHPNYLGEITVWVGVYLTMLPFAQDKWYYGIGALLVALLFNFISIPLMEKRQLQRRIDYADYMQKTSRLLIKIKGRRN